MPYSNYDLIKCNSSLKKQTDLVKSTSCFSSRLPCNTLIKLFKIIFFKTAVEELIAYSSLLISGFGFHKCSYGKIKTRMKMMRIFFSQKMVPQVCSKQKLLCTATFYAGSWTQNDQYLCTATLYADSWTQNDDTWLIIYNYI